MACRARCVFELSVCVFIVSVFLGCDGPKTGVKTGNTEDGIPWPGGTYTPKFPPGIEALEAAKKDLTELLRTDTRDDCAGIRYYGELDFSKPANRDNPVAYMTRVDAYMVIRNARGEFQYMLPRSGFTVLDDRITVGTVFTLFYADLLESQIAIDKNPDGEIRTSWLGTDHKIYNDTDAAFAKYSKRYRPMYMRPHRVQCTGLISFFFKSQTGAERFADDLFFIQQTLKKQNDERLALFESKAAQYRDMAVKPEMSQAQRRYIVQADVLATQQKDYAGAIDLYLKAVDLDPVSHPEAYINLAMLSAQQNRYKSAISYMKQYLRLMPGVQNAQDKIYEWEILMQK